MKLILFDVDKTLIDAHGAGRRALERTFEHILGHTAGLEQVAFGGKTDPMIVREALQKGGVPPSEILRLTPHLLRHYPGELARELTTAPPPARLTVLPGVRPLLERLHTRDDIVLGLLTGNVEACAWLKLQVAGLYTFFTFGAFGDDGETRDDLPAVAMQRAWEESGYRFGRDDVVIIGDTPRDVRCAQLIGGRSIAVATGPFSADALHTAGADVVFPSLADTQSVLQALGLPDRPSIT
nr:haloacid dehalogenase-like hydrolase [Ardenticatena sp.]